jgi:hypothetical protein
MSILSRHAECKRSVWTSRSLRCRVTVGRLGGIGVTRNETFGSSVASAAVMTADIGVTVTAENSRESGRA